MTIILEDDTRLYGRFVGSPEDGFKATIERWRNALTKDIYSYRTGVQEGSAGRMPNARKGFKFEIEGDVKTAVWKIVSATVQPV